MSNAARKHAAVRSEAERIGTASIPLRRLAARIQYDDRDLASILFSAAAVMEAAGRDLTGMRGELVRTLGRAADAIEAVASRAPVAADDEPLPP